MRRRTTHRKRRKALIFHAMFSRPVCVLAALTLLLGPVSVRAADPASGGKAVPAVTGKKEQDSGGTTADKKKPAEKSDAAAKKDKPKDQALSEEKKAEWIDQTLDFGTQEERTKAIDRISQVKDPAARGRLTGKLIILMKEEEEPELLVKAITVLSELKENGAIPLMTGKLDHRSEEVRTAAVYGLKDLKGVSAKEKMIEKLKAQNLENGSNYTDALIQALAEFKAVETVPFMKEALEKNTTAVGVKESMIIFLGKAGSRDARDVLLKLYRDEDENSMLRAYSVNSLAKLGMKDVTGDIKAVTGAIEAMEAKKRKQYNDLYLYSVAALARLGDQDAVPKLVNSLRSNNAQVRLRAISLIKDFKEKRTIDILKYKMKYDQNPKVQAAAKSALKEMGVEVPEEKAP